MTSLYPLLVALHGIAGALALLTFWMAALARKGGPWHRRAGQAYLGAMGGILVTAPPLAAARFAEGHSVTGAFLAYLVVISATGVWTAWRAVRDRDDVERYTGPVYRALAGCSLAAGLAVLALGILKSVPLLIGFSAIGLVSGLDMLRKRRNRAALARRPRWWMVEHYTAMLGNGIATHIAFLAIGLPRLLPALDGTMLHYAAWFGPIAVALVSKALLDRRWAPRAPALPVAPARTPG